MADELILPGEPPIAVRLKTSAAARRLSLRVSKLDGRVTLTLPRHARRREAEAFVREKADWIRRHHADTPGEIRPMPGGRLMFRGEELDLRPAATRSVRLVDGAIEIPARDPARTPARLAAFLKVAARDALAEASGRHAEALGLRFTEIALRDTRSRWGSCSHDGRLMYSWRLIMAPPEVLDYVAAHEVAHLREMNHSDRFWATVSETCPQFAGPRRWLKTHGGTLHRYRFRD